MMTPTIITDHIAKVKKKSRAVHCADIGIPIFAMMASDPLDAIW